MQIFIIPTMQTLECYNEYIHYGHTNTNNVFILYIVTLGIQVTKGLVDKKL